jgi:Fur family transcriptional regulator, ferric uptake regulator
MKNQIFEKKLQARNIQPTAMRLLVLDFLEHQQKAVSLADLEEHLSRSDRATLYRTLKTFHEHGLVHQIFDNSGNAKYALCSDDCTCSYPDDMHVHFYCTVCEKAYCFQQLSIPEIELPENFKPDSVNFVINGTCAACLN